jgi:hypothetical protein
MQRKEAMQKVRTDIAGTAPDYETMLIISIFLVKIATLK